MFQVDQYFPVQGVNKFRTVSFPITKAFAYDFGAFTSGTATKAIAARRTTTDNAVNIFASSVIRTSSHMQL